VSTSNYVTYFIGQNQRGSINHGTTLNSSNVYSSAFTSGQSLNINQITAAQQQTVDDYIKLSSNPDRQSLGVFVEQSEHKKNNKWPQLTKAIETCQQHDTLLIIAELGTLTNNESFTNKLLNANINFYCCDQPFINQTNLEALAKYAQAQKKLHGKLIREGLQKTTAKSGNPNAAEVISKVNKPKIDTAIIFACLLQPIISDYRKKGYSQRQMVKSLNEEGFTAPEGGKWVLSQLQKVLDRVKLNEIAIQLLPTITAFKDNELNDEQIANELNGKHTPAIKRGNWDDSQVKRLLERIDQINEISKINQFVLDLIPILHEYKAKNFTSIDILKKLEKSGLPIKQEIVTTTA
jgi:hypothetical protein